MTTPAAKKRYSALAIINLLALAISLHLVRLHFQPDLSEFCDLSDRWNCDIVNKSIYATLFGVPVSILGAITYLGLLAFSVRGLLRNQQSWVPFIFAGLSGAVAFSLYLTSVEAFILKTFCIFCVSQQILILIEYGIFISFLKPYKRHL